MDDDTRDLIRSAIDNAQNSDAVAFRDNINTILSTKINDLINDQKITVASTLLTQEPIDTEDYEDE